MRWSCVAFATSVTLVANGVYSIPLHATRGLTGELDARSDNGKTELPYNSDRARKLAAANEGLSQMPADTDAGHVLPKEAFGALLDKHNIPASQLSSETKHMHEEQTVPEPSGQNRGAGNKEAKNVGQILDGKPATHPISSGHRDMQTDPANRQMAVSTVSDFKKAVKADTGMDMPGAEKDAEKILDNQPCGRDLVDENGMLNVRDLYDENGNLDRRAAHCALPAKKTKVDPQAAAAKAAAKWKAKTFPGKTDKPAAPNPAANTAAKSKPLSKAATGGKKREYN